jgi:hypothetical protein
MLTAVCIHIWQCLELYYVATHNCHVPTITTRCSQLVYLLFWNSCTICFLDQKVSCSIHILVYRFITLSELYPSGHWHKCVTCNMWHIFPLCLFCFERCLFAWSLSDLSCLLQRDVLVPTLDGSDLIASSKTGTGEGIRLWYTPDQANNWEERRAESWIHIYLVVATTCNAAT